jgi:hypothetical protein
MARLDRCYNVEDLRTEAKRRLPKWIFEFVDRGSEDESALADNREAFRRIKLRNRVLVDLTDSALGTTLFGKALPLPLVIAPTGAAGSAGTRARSRQRAAAKFGVVHHGHRLDLLDRRGGEGRRPTLAAAHLCRIAIFRTSRRAAKWLRGARRHRRPLMATTANRARNGHGIRSGSPTRSARHAACRAGSRAFLPYFVTTGPPKQANNPPAFANMHTLAARMRFHLGRHFEVARDLARQALVKAAASRRCYQGGRLRRRRRRVQPWRATMDSAVAASTRCRRSSPRSARAPRSWWTAASGAAATS